MDSLKQEMNHVSIVKLKKMEDLHVKYVNMQQIVKEKKQTKLDVNIVLKEDF
jgi:hypothetical protein